MYTKKQNIYARDPVNASNDAVKIKSRHELNSFVPKAVHEELPHRPTVEKKRQWISECNGYQKLGGLSRDTKTSTDAA